MIIPIFIPHEGCHNDCAFCNQRTISGKERAPSLKETVRIIETHLETTAGKADGIAFFGGSFTGLDIKKQNEYLSIGQKYVNSGAVRTIRLSTRPDYIDRDTVKRLFEYGVTNVELGAQSMDEEVLRLAKRGHTAFDVEKASEIIKSAGITLGLQMMTGLPGDNIEKDLYTAKRFKELGAEETRIYPTVVLGGTYLEKMYKLGEYIPQSIEDAVEICAELYRFFKNNCIRILRIGLADSNELRDNYIAGAFHPSLGEMVISRDIRNRIEKNVKQCSEINIASNPSFISKIKGNKKCNVEYFKNKGIKLNVIVDKNAEEFYFIGIDK